MSAHDEAAAPATPTTGLYDTQRLENLRRDLRQLNSAALRDGLVALSGGRLVTHASLTAQAKAKATKGRWDGARREARRLLVLLSADETDESPLVVGTSCTEAGVVRLFTELRRARSRKNPFLRRLQRYLTRPVAFGMRTVAGISVVRVQTMVRHLEEIEQHGWDHYVARRAERRGRQAMFSPPATEEMLLSGDENE